METLLRICAVVALALAASGGAVAQNIETFDCQADDWFICYGNLAAENWTDERAWWDEPPAHARSHSFGQPDYDGLYAFATNKYGSPISGNWPSNSKLLGNMSAYRDGAMTADTKLTGSLVAEGTTTWGGGTYANTVHVRVTIGRRDADWNGWTYYSSPVWDVTADTNWATHTFAFDDFVQTSHGGTGVESLDWVLADVTEVGILASYCSGGVNYQQLEADGLARLMLDNIGYIPEPGMLALVGLGALGLLVRKRR